MGRWSQPEKLLQGKKDRQTDNDQEYSRNNRALLVPETQVGEIWDLEVFCPSVLPVSLLLASTWWLILLFITCLESWNFCSQWEFKGLIGSGLFSILWL